MYKFIQVLEGTNTWDFEVTSGTKLSLLFTTVHILEAEVTLRIRLMGVGASASVTGIVVAGGQEKVVIRTVQIHEAPSTTSDLLVKTVLSGHATCLYDGGIRVEKSAMKTDAYQRNENLLLSDNAYAESRPSLEILANDVRCTHGAATGPVNEEQLWYLTSRGISQRVGEALLVRGFIQSAVDRVVEQRAKRDIMSLWEITSK
jgi:Fe-S cluster assembly protein SufD